MTTWERASKAEERCTLRFSAHSRLRLSWQDFTIRRSDSEFHIDLESSALNATAAALRKLRMLDIQGMWGAAAIF
jgi:hypothetical protein